MVRVSIWENNLQPFKTVHIEYNEQNTQYIYLFIYHTKEETHSKVAYMYLYIIIIILQQKQGRKEEK